MAEHLRRRAAFLDRDGTLIRDQHYLCEPEGVELLPGAVDALRLLTAAGIPAVVITNQSGIARGRITLAQHRAVRRRLDELLATEGVPLLDTFSCPHHPAFTGPCDCRKPGTALYERAAAAYELDLARSLYIGDRMRDVSAAATFGGSAFLLPSAHTSPDDLARSHAAGVTVVPTLLEAVRAALSA